MRRRRAVVLIMVLGIIAAMTAVATAFVMFMNQAYRAAANTQYTAQAELACRSGLEHAIRAIRESMNLYVCETHAVAAAGTVYDDLAAHGAKVGWCRYFEGGTEMVRYTDTGDPNPHVIAGRLFLVGAPLTQMEYAIRVYDLDGALHANLPLWTDGQATGTSDLQDMISDLGKQAGLDDTQADVLADESDDLGFSSLSEMARRAGVVDTAKKYALEQFFTAHPLRQDESDDMIISSPVYDSPSNTSEMTVTVGGMTPGAHAGKAVWFDGGGHYRISGNDADTITVMGDAEGETATDIKIVVVRPAVNINTVSEALLADLIEPIPTFSDTQAGLLAALLCQKRPFLGRHDFEEAVRRVTGDDAVAAIAGFDPPDDHLSEIQFNDLLNSFAGALGSDGGAFDEDDSAYDDPDNPGEYSFDGWSPYADWEGPAQTGGEATSPDDNVTWSTEIRFTSRFFHIYVLGRGWNPKSNRPRGIRRLHAVYDAEARRIVWLRWNLSDRGSVSDILP